MDSTSEDLKSKRPIIETISLSSLPTFTSHHYPSHRTFSLSNLDFSEEQKEALTKLWKSVSIASIVDKQTPFVIKHDTPTIEALSSLGTHAIMSAPVVNETGRIISMLDYRDFCALIIRAYTIITDALSAKRTKLSDDDSIEITSTHNRVASIEQILKHVPAGTIANFSRRDNFYSVQYNESLAEAMHLFAQGIHRLVVLDEHGGFKGMVSQSDALRELSKHINDSTYDFLFSRTLKDLGLNEHPDKPVLTVAKSTMLLDALNIMQENGISSIAILNENKSIIGCFSMNDFKYIISAALQKSQSNRSSYGSACDEDPAMDGQDQDHSCKNPLALLEGTCEDFLSELTYARDKEANFQTRIPVFHCNPESTLKRTIALITAIKTHRLWVTKCNQEFNVPIAVLTLTDILHVSVPLESSHFDAIRKRGIQPIQFVPATYTEENLS